MPRKEPRTLSMELDGRKIYFPEGATVLRAAELNGVDIPSLCSHKDLSPFGGCRLCVVEIDGRAGLPPLLQHDGGRGNEGPDRHAGAPRAAEGIPEAHPERAPLELPHLR